ncbi:SEC-C domain-containing protein [Novosphingobium sp. 1949]|uniref:SEC-C domain-containing protein n=1 Tax=Novosphingobium organovorum TaxID=2930092 RepID=A0ABT0BGB0_9SPHN|nr:SEC-C metal-binding domain-containing protein [Novosphingobium organovorum]MCJ2184061.1 SEC-C domain-containing protein [Novosphingobium organovorum]
MLRPNDLCPCGSGRKYKKCHRIVDLSSSDQKYVAAQAVYAANWKVTAELQYERGDYAWMAEQLKPFEVKRVLDVGCGSGHGLLALTECLPSGLRVVAIDENLACLKVAQQTLQKSGLPAPLIERLETVETPYGFLQTDKPISLPLAEPIALIEADPLTDNYLEKAVLHNGLFDAVTIWLTGAHSWRRHNAYSVHRGVKDEHDLRIVIQNEVYELADRVLRPGGVLQVVDRSEAPTSDFIRQGYFESHREQAEPTTMDVREVGTSIYLSPSAP